MAFPETPCESCPRRAAGIPGPCPNQGPLPTPRRCRLATEDGPHRAFFAAFARGEIPPEKDDTIQAGREVIQGEPSGRDTRTEPLDLAYPWGEKNLRCAHRRGCGCRDPGYQCGAAGRRPGERVSIEDCRACPEVASR